MADAGISPLALYDPELYLKQQQIQRQQAFGQALLQQGAQGGDYRQPYSGLAAAGNELLGAYLLKHGDRNLAQLYGAGSDQPQTAPATSQPPPQPSPTPQGAPSSPPQASAPVGMSLSMPAPAQGAPQPASGGGQGASGGVADRIYSDPGFPRIPGVDPRIAMQALFEGGQAWTNYMQAFYTSVQPTPEQKNALAAVGGDPELARQLLLGKANKDATVIGRPGGGALNLATGQFTGFPGQTGLTPTQLPNGQIGLQMAPGGAQAVAQSAFAQKAPGALLTPQVGYDLNNRPIATNSAVMSGQGPAVSALMGGAPGGPAPSPQPLAPQPSPMPPPAGGVGAPAPGNFSLAPALAPGTGKFLDTLGGEAGQRANETVENAQDVPTRLNVLGNVLALSRVTQTNSPQWLTAARTLAAQLGQATGHPVDPNNQAALLSEIQKYMAQYATRMHQTGGGTGTDAQLEAIQHANPNDAMFPATLQRIVPWIMANERGVAAKANAQSAWLGQPGNNTPAAQQQFEAFWRNNYSPRIAQFEQMSPQQKQGYLMDRNAFPTQQSLLDFQKQYKTLHPFFSVPQ